MSSPASETESRLTEATALQASRAPAQPAAPTPRKSILVMSAAGGVVVLQPAAPTLDRCRVCGSADIDHGAEHLGAVEFPDSICEECYRRGTSSAPKEPAAPEPSAEIDELRRKLEEAERGERDAVAALDSNWVTHQRVVSAEAQLAAARKLLNDRDTSPDRRIMQALTLLTAPSPGAGETRGPERCDVCDLPQTVCDELSCRGMGADPGRSGK